MSIVSELDSLENLELLEKLAFSFSLSKAIPKPLSSVRPTLGNNTTFAQRPTGNSVRFNTTMTSPQSAIGHQTSRQVAPLPPAPPKPVSPFA